MQRKYSESQGNPWLSCVSWEQRKLGEISNKVTKKNQDAVVDEVFTNSAEFGIISQRDFFEKDIANAENIDGYYVVESDDFVMPVPVTISIVTLLSAPCAMHYHSAKAHKRGKTP